MPGPRPFVEEVGVGSHLPPSVPPPPPPEEPPAPPSEEPAVAPAPVSGQPRKK